MSNLFGLDAAILKELSKKGCMPIVDFEPVERIPSGSLSLDYVLGGGWPRGRISIVTGESSYGKTTILMLTAGYVASHPDQMKNRGLVAYFDTENTYDPRWAEKLGLDPTRVHLYQPESGEQMQDTIYLLLQKKVYDMIVVDSVAETAFNAEYEGSAEDSHVGVAARKWSQFRRKVKNALTASGTALVFINQISLKIGVTMGDPETEYGGKALPYAAVIRLKMLFPDRKSKPGFIIFRPKTVKNKTAPSGREGAVELYVGTPDAPVGKPFVYIVPEITSVGKSLNVFTKEDGTPITGSGYWYFGDKKLGVGEAATQKLIFDDPELFYATEAAVRKAIDDMNRSPIKIEIDEETGLILDGGEIELPESEPIQEG